MQASKSRALLKVYVDLKNQNLLLYQDDQLVRRYSIMEISETLTTGKYAIYEKLSNPKENLGMRWIGLNRHPFGIHGEPLNDYDQICLGLRLSNENLVQLYALIPIGTIVEVTKSFDELQSPAVPNRFGRFPATPSAFPVVNGPRSYIVQKGDTIWKLAHRYNISMEKILAANLLSDPNRLEQGQIIVLPLPWP